MYMTRNVKKWHNYEHNIKSEPLVFKSDVLFFCLNIDLSRVYGDLLDNSVLNTKVKTV